MMMKCGHGHTFDADLTRKRRYIGGEVETFCPYCDDDELTEVFACDVCGEYFEHLNGISAAICDGCLQKAATVGNAFKVGAANLTHINGFFEQLFTHEEIESILMREAKARNLPTEDDAREYIMQDPQWFADFLKWEAENA